MTIDDFIKKSKEKHGNKYDYSLVNYLNSNTKVKIICSVHGVFEQIAKSHYKGHGCLYCSNNKKISTTEFINRCLNIHGDKYDYSLVDYKSSNIKIDIICKQHGIFKQTPNSHLSKHGCFKCYGNLKKSKYDIISDFKNTHGDKYDYSLVGYKNNKHKVKIICRKHGIFEQLPTGHINGKGCKKCANELLSLNNTKTKEIFIEESKKIHGDKYDYSLVEYKGAHIKVKIICKEHGIFNQLPNSHINGSNCKKCSNIKISELLKYNNNNFIEKSIEIHGDKYDYSLVEYKGAHIKIKIICKEHGVFLQRPYSHLQNVGCPDCYKSKGELKVKKFLNDNNLIYKEQYKFIDCVNILPLSFDFYLPNENILIEYDGEQHFRKYRFEKNNIKLNERIKRDNIKNLYCKENNIKLIRIKYTKIKFMDDILRSEIFNI